MFRATNKYNRPGIGDTFKSFQDSEVDCCVLNIIIYIYLHFEFKRKNAHLIINL